MEYLTDSLVEKSKSDQFGHLEIAKEIRKIITNDENLDKSVTIGIFGKWGVGKSSVLHLLRFEELKEEENNLVYIDIPIWKYADPKSIRRKFIYQIAKKLNQEDEIKKIYYDVTTEGSVSFLKRINKVIKELRSDVETLLFYFLAIIIISFITYAIIKEISLNSFLLFYNSAISIAIVGFIIKLIQDIKFSKTSETQKVYEGEEQFEHLVEECLKKSKEKKIFIIDDLDRCDSSKILSVFEAIKNFISIDNCVFIIACDPDIIRKAIDNETNNKITENTGTDTKIVIHSKNSGFYLEKIFQYVIEIPGFLPQNMRDYAKKVIIDADLELFKDGDLKNKLDRIIYTLIYKDTFNPRKVKTLVNRFILNYNLAVKLEANEKSFLSKGILTAFPERLALFSVIKSDFPHIVDKLKEAPSYKFRNWVAELENQDDFKEYINQNQELFEEDWSVLPFLYFNNDPSINSLKSTQLENLPILSSSLRNGNINTINEHLKSTKDIENFICYTYNQIEILNNTVEINNAAKILTSLFEKIDFKTISIERNDVSETKLLQQINNQIRSKNVSHNGLIAYIAYLLIHSSRKGISVLDSYFESNLELREESMLAIFSDKFFKIFDDKAKRVIIKYVSPSKDNLTNLISLVNNLNVDESNYSYFEKGFTEISSIYNETITETIPKNDINIIEPVYFRILKLSLRYNYQDFSILLQKTTPINKIISEFENELQDYSEDGMDSLLNGIVQHCNSNNLSLIEDLTLSFFKSAVGKC